MEEVEMYIDTEKQLVQFAVSMRKQLLANDYKSGWRTCDLKYLFHRLQEEIEELSVSCKLGHHEEVTHEAANVANFAFMIKDLVCSS